MDKGAWVEPQRAGPPEELRTVQAITQTFGWPLESRSVGHAEQPLARP